MIGTSTPATHARFEAAILVGRPPAASRACRPLLALVAFAISALPATAQSPRARQITPGLVLDTTIAVGAAHDYAIRLATGESVDLAVVQTGVDLVVEVRSPDGALMAIVDSPNGRSGDEPVEIVAAAPGTYRLRVRPFDAREPAGPYRIRVSAWRNAGATRALLRGRQLARDSAVSWLAPRSVAIPASGVIPPNVALPPLESLARRARVIGIGEANHGSREFGDLRLSLTQRLIERHGFRVVAIEASSSRLDLLNRFIAGEAVPAASVTRAIERGWIGRRPLRELVSWLRRWNGAHPADRVDLTGVDPQDNEIAADSLRGFLGRAYGAELLTRLQPTMRELAAADSQYLVFGNSDVDSTARRSILEIVAMLDLDAPMLSRKFGAPAVDRAREAARELAEFADLNGGQGKVLGHWRDWYMAKRVVAALEKRGARARGVYWAHNAHVGIRKTNPPAGQSAGTWLRDLLGCEYAALGVTFGSGSFVAQIPNDLTDRLAVSTLPTPPEETLEGVLTPLHRGGSIVVWSCADSSSAPAWLRSPRLMHWVGGLYTPGTFPSEAFRPYDILREFDGLVYIDRVTADEMPTDRPLIRARKR
jgi:erythromycin esterase